MCSIYVGFTLEKQTPEKFKKKCKSNANKHTAIKAAKRLDTISFTTTTRSTEHMSGMSDSDSMSDMSDGEAFQMTSRVWWTKADENALLAAWREHYVPGGVSNGARFV